MPGADLVGAGYQTVDPLALITNRLPSATVAGQFARTNAHLFGLSNLKNFKTVTAKQLTAAIPVSGNEQFTKAGIWGYKAAASGSVNFLAVYEGVEQGKKGKLIQQTEAKTEETTEAGLYELTLKEPIVVTPTLAPHGFLYVSFCGEEGTTTAEVVIGEFANAKIAALAAGAGKEGAPALAVAEAAQKGAKEAAAELTMTAGTKAPIVYLR